MRDGAPVPQARARSARAGKLWVTHVVVTDAFAGTERYVAEVAAATAARGHDVTVVGGDPTRMPAQVGPAVTWRPGADLWAAVQGLRHAGRPDVVHAHLTAAETAAFLARPWHRAPCVSTRHIAASRGSSLVARRLLAPALRRWIKTELAISATVAAALEAHPSVVLHNGVQESDAPYAADSRTVLLLQRLEPEKATATALDAWGRSGLGETGWALHVAGDGSQRGALECLVRRAALPGVEFLGLVPDVAARLSGSALLLAPARHEPLGLSVLEAMAAGVPVLAAAAGGHLESLPPGYPWTFPVDDVAKAALLLRSLAGDRPARTAVSDQLRARQRELFSLDVHVDRLLEHYRRTLDA